MAQLPVLSLFRSTTRRYRAASCVLVKVERKVAADETKLARIDVVRLDLRVRRVVELLAERALVVGVFDKHERRVVLSDREAARRERHAHLVADGLRLCLRRRGCSRALLQRLADR